MMPGAGAGEAAMLAMMAAVPALAVAAGPRATAVAVADQGTTRIVIPGAPTVVATITTWRAAAAEATGRVSRCSGGRTPCSLVDRLTIEVAGRPVEVSPRAVLLLADVDDARLRVLGRGRYELVLTCGDAAPAYQARLFFDARRLDRMDIWSDEAGTVEQSTTFHDLSKAFR